MKQLAENVHLTPAEDALEIIDQTLLPGEKKLIRLKSRDELYEAIFSLRVRGAPAIGIFAGYALYVLAKSIPHRTFPISTPLCKKRPNIWSKAAPPQ